MTPCRECGSIAGTRFAATATPIDLQDVRLIIIDVFSDHVPSLSRTERLILELLAVEETFGLGLVQRSNGALKRGTVYVTLGRMQEKGYLESRTEALPPGAMGLPRRFYRPTALGLRVLKAWALAGRALHGRPQEA